MERKRFVGAVHGTVGDTYLWVSLLDLRVIGV